MTQRSPLNERYQDEKRGGKTRKSASSAKPKTARAATVRDPAPKSKKQKKAEQREREVEAERKLEQRSGKPFESTPEYKKYRRIWWVLLVGAIVMTALSFFMMRDEALQSFSWVVLIVAYALIIGAFALDFIKIRKMRKNHALAAANDKSKAARAEQKKRRAEAREQEKEAEEKMAAAKAEEEARAAEKANRGPLGWFRKSKADASDAKENLEAKAEKEKERLESEGSDKDEKSVA